MKIWHRLESWILDRKIRREHYKLAKYVRQSAYEINAWKQDIAFLEESRDFHRSFLAPSLRRQGRAHLRGEGTRHRPRRRIPHRRAIIFFLPSLLLCDPSRRPVREDFL